MEDLLLPNGSEGNMIEPTCCSPTRLKLKTFPIKFFSVFHIICGVSTFGLGIVLTTLDQDNANNHSTIIFGIVFTASGIFGIFVRKHGFLATVYGSFCSASLVGSTVVFTYSLLDLYWSDWFGLTLATVIVVVVEMVASLLGLTLSLRNANWKTVFCQLKKQNDSQINTDQSTQNNSGSTMIDEPPSLEPCWKPCHSRGHRNACIILSVTHVIIGIISTGLGIWLVVIPAYRSSQHGSVLPILSGLLVFGLTGICGLMSVFKKGSYVSCFLSLSVLSFVMSTTMTVWMIGIGIDFDSWLCRYECSDDQSRKLMVDYITLGVSVLEMLISMASFGVSLSQLSCYTCCNDMRENCTCCNPRKNGQYFMLLDSEGNFMTLPVPQAHCGVPDLTGNNGFMVVQSAQMVAKGQPVRNEGTVRISDNTGPTQFEGQ